MPAFCRSLLIESSLRCGRHSTPAHAPPCLRLRARQQGARHAGATGLLGHRNIHHTVRYGDTMWNSWTATLHAATRTG
jgi:hypothetical protein